MKSLRVVSVVSLGLLASCATTSAVEKKVEAAVDAGVAVVDDRLPGEAVLATQPVIPPLGSFAVAAPVEASLPNGLKVLVVERPGGPIEALELLVRAGSASDPAGKPGLASMTAAMLEAGSAKKSQAEVAAQANALGTELSAGASTDAITVALSAMPARTEALMKLLGDVVQRPNFDPAEWKKVQDQRLAQLRDSLTEPRVAAANAFRASLYGSGPLGHSTDGTQAAVKAMTLTDVKRFWAEVGPADATLIVVGPVPQAQVLALAKATFGGWKGGAKAKVAAPVAPPAARPRVVLVEFPERPQTVLMVGQPGVPSASPDELPLQVMNVVLGGAFTSRLNQNLREQHGYSYGAGSRFAFGKNAGPFMAMSSVKTAVTGAALKEMLFELGRVVTDALTDEEVAKGKSMLAYGLVEQLSRAESTAGLVASYVSAGVPVDSLATLVPRLQAVTAAEVQAAAKRVLDPATMTITLAGDASVVDQAKAAGLELPAPQKRGPEGELK